MRVVAIDGAAGTGKSTLAERLARHLALPYVNTGLMYRALAAAALRQGVAPDDERALLEIAEGLRFFVRIEPVGALEVQGYEMTELMSIEVESTVSIAASHAAVRSSMRREQRALGEANGAVMEGRDIASAVFPDAPVKLYLRAPSSLRAERRAAQRDDGRLDEVATALEARDDIDAITNPHEPAPGAVVIDTSDIDPDGTFDAALAVIRTRAPELLP